MRFDTKLRGFKDVILNNSCGILGLSNAASFEIL